MKEVKAFIESQHLFAPTMVTITLKTISPEFFIRMNLNSFNLRELTFLGFDFKKRSIESLQVLAYLYYHVSPACRKELVSLYKFEDFAFKKEPVFYYKYYSNVHKGVGTLFFDKGFLRVAVDAGYGKIETSRFFSMHEEDTFYLKNLTRNAGL